MSVNLEGLHPIAGRGYWTPGVITEAGQTYTIRVDAPLNGQDTFSGVTADRLQPGR